MNDICATCLATDRRLKVLNESGVFGILNYLMVQTGYNKLRGTNKVCWECIAQLKNVRKFQTKALDSLQRLQEYSNNSEIHNEYDSQTTLSVINLCNINILDASSDIDEEHHEDFPELDHDDATDLPIKHEKSGDDSEMDLDIPGSTDPLSIVDTELGILDEDCEDEITNIKNDGVEFEDNLQIRVKDFANLKPEPIKSENDKNTLRNDKQPPLGGDLELDAAYKLMKTYEEYTNDIRKRFKCHMCQYRARRKSDLTKHIRTHTGEKPFECHLCEYRAKAKSNLVSHIRTHTGEKPFKCDLCEYRAERKGTLIIHSRTHTGEKPFQCHLCNYNSIQVSNLKKHLRTTHTVEKPYVKKKHQL